jgi:MSHA biogenesis protein MshP
VSAIFLLVALAALGAGMVMFSTAQNRNLAMDIQGSRAYQAAQAGIEWAAYNIAAFPGAGGGTVFVPATGTALGGNLSDFTVAVVYAAASATADTSEGPDVVGGVVWSYNITSTATLGVPGTAGYIERVVTAKR